MFFSLHDYLVVAVRKYLNYRNASLMVLEKHIVGDAYLWVATQGKTIVEKGNAMGKEVGKENDSCKEV